MQMAIRVTLFISLLAIFYSYCKDDGSEGVYNEPNDLNSLEVPVQSYPNVTTDSLNYSGLVPRNGYESKYFYYFF